DVTESLRRFARYRVLTFIVTSTGVRGLLGTTRIADTLATSTPCKRTGAPWRRPLALSKNDWIVILRENIPPVWFMRKTSTMSVMLATITVMPTLSCDHLTCFWLGTFSSDSLDQTAKAV